MARLSWWRKINSGKIEQGKPFVAPTAVGAMRSVSATATGATSIRLNDQPPVGTTLRGIWRQRDDPTGSLGGPYGIEDPATSTSREFLTLAPDTTYTLSTAAVDTAGVRGPVTSVTARTDTAALPVSGTNLPDSLPWDGRTRPGYGPGDLLEKTYTKVVSIAGAGMVEGAGGDPVANGNKLRSFLSSVMAGTIGQVCVEIPAAVPQRFRIAENVNLPGRLTLKGMGLTANGRPDPTKVTFEHTTDTKALFMVDGQNDVELFNMTHYVPGGLTRRSAAGQSGEGNTWVQNNAQRFRAQDYIAWGGHDAPMFFYGAHNFTVNRVESRDSQSDAWHVSNGSSYGTWYDCKSVSSGDDGIGFVGYGGEGAGTPHHHTVVRHQMLEQQPNGRGFGNIHVYSIRYFGPTLIEDSWAAGFICAREPAYGSGRVRDIKVYGELRIRRANKSPVIPHGAILLANDGTDGVAIEDIYFEGPLVLVGTGELRTGNPSQIGIRGAGPVTNVRFGQAYFYNPRNDPDVNQTKYSTGDPGNKTNIVLEGWSASTPTIAGAEPPFPIQSETRASTTKPALWMSMNGAPTDAEIALHAPRVRAVMLNIWETAARDKIKAANPSCKVLAYICMSSTRTTSGTTSTIYPTGITYNEANTLHPEWFAKKASDGTRHQWGSYAGHWQMAVWDAAYRARWIEVTLGRISGWDGVFADNDLYDAYDSTYYQGCANKAALVAAYDTFTQQIGVALHNAGKLLIPNLVNSRLNPGKWDLRAAYGGGLDEFAFMFGPGTPYMDNNPSTGWPVQVDECDGPGMSLIRSAGTPGDAFAEKYGFASFLIGGGGVAGAYTLNQTDTGYGGVHWFPEQGWDLGAPLEPMQSVGANAKTRRFENGFVAVNPQPYLGPYTSQVVTVPDNTRLRDRADITPPSSVTLPAFGAVIYRKV